MLSSLTLKNFALVKSETINFCGGFNCLLGQSGAGKSVIIDALNFLLGGKTNKDLIRSGEQQLRVDGIFCDVPQPVVEALKNFEIECEDELILSRTLSADGKSTSRVNGVPVTAKTLQIVTRDLAEFCGQHESVGLLDEANHLSILDDFAGQDVQAQKAEVKAFYAQLSSVKKQIAALGGDEEKRARELDLLHYQVDEITKANLSQDEETSLRQRYDFIGKAEKVFESVNGAIAALDADRDNALLRLHEAENLLSGVSEFESIGEACDRLESSYYEIQDVVASLKEVRNDTKFNPTELEEIDARLDQIKGLKRKYGRTIEDVLNFAQEAQNRIDELENNEFQLKKLRAEETNLAENLEENCIKLSELRRSAAFDFERQIMQELVDLEMKGTNFVVEFSKAACTQNGFDDVKFFFSANVGQEVRKLSRVASGGELSRVMLAFKNVLRGHSEQTVIFDEIDSGISGRTAAILADKLKSISNFNQIICITHTPIVASKANNFLLVQKRVEGGETFSSVQNLQGEAVVRELARLIDDSEDVSQTALEHARKLLSDAK